MNYRQKLNEIYKEVTDNKPVKDIFGVIIPETIEKQLPNRRTSTP